MVERAFRELKGLMEMRPIYHQTQTRVRAHLFVAHLALLLGCALHKALTQAGLTFALDTALEALRPIRLVELEVAGQPLRLVTRPGPHGQAVLRAVGIHQLTPPGDVVEKKKPKSRKIKASKPVSYKHGLVGLDGLLRLARLRGHLVGDVGRDLLVVCQLDLEVARPCVIERRSGA